MDARMRNTIVCFFVLCAFYISGAQRDVPIVNPTNPTTPTNPGTGGNPTNPGTGGNPTNPGTGGNPTNPGTGGNPTNPGTGGNPTNPGTFPPTNPTTPTPTTGGSGGGWCVANPSASETALQVSLDYACGYGGTDCSAIQPNAACYNPNTVRDHASYAFNDYYQRNPVPTSCDFGGTAQLVYTDPSNGNCRYSQSTGASTIPPPTPTAPTTPTPPTPTMPMTPPSPTSTFPTGGGSEPGGYDYGEEPTGSPNSAGTSSINILALVAILSATIAKYL